MGSLIRLFSIEWQEPWGIWKKALVAKLRNNSGICLKGQKKIMTTNGQVRISTVCLPYGNQKHQLSAADICGC